MVSTNRDTVVLEINNQNERISRDHLERAPNPNWEVVTSRKPLPRLLPSSDVVHAPTVTPGPAILPHPERGLSDLPIISDTHKPESVTPSWAQNPDSLRVLPPLEVFSPPVTPLKEGEGDKTNNSVALASPGKPPSRSVHTDETVILNPTADAGRALGTRNTDYRARNTVGNEKKTPLMEGHFNKTQVPWRSSWEPTRVIRIAYAPSQVENTAPASPGMGSDLFTGDKDEEPLGKSTEHFGIA